MSLGMSLTCLHYYHLCLQHQKYVMSMSLGMSLSMSSVCHWHKRTRLTILLVYAICVTVCELAVDSTAELTFFNCVVLLIVNSLLLLPLITTAYY
jgi:hypothetical protein